MSPIERSGGGGGSSGQTVLFDSTLSGAAASIDTGAGGIAGGFNHLHIEVYVRESGAVIAGSLVARFNNDSGANYDDVFMRNNAGTVSGSSDVATTSFFLTQMPGASAAASYFASAFGSINSYAVTTAGFKTGMAMGGFAVSTANQQQITIQYAWRSTAAITRMAIFPLDGTNLLTGSRLTIYGL